MFRISADAFRTYIHVLRAPLVLSCSTHIDLLLYAVVDYVRFLCRILPVHV